MERDGSQHDMRVRLLAFCTARQHGPLIRAEGSIVCRREPGWKEREREIYGSITFHFSVIDFLISVFNALPGKLECFMFRA